MESGKGGDGRRGGTVEVTAKGGVAILNVFIS